MTIELGGFAGTFFLGMPLRLSGTVLLVLDVLLLLGLIFIGRGRKSDTSRLARSWGAATLLILAVAAPILSQVFLIRAVGVGAAPVPGLPGNCVGHLPACSERCRGCWPADCSASRRRRWSACWPAWHGAVGRLTAC